MAAQLLHRFRRTFHRKVKAASKQESVVLLDDHNSSAGSSAEIPLAVRLRRAVQSLIARIEPDGYKPLATRGLRSLSARDRFSTGPEALITRGHKKPSQHTTTKHFTSPQKTVRSRNEIPLLLISIRPRPVLRGGRQRETSGEVAEKTTTQPAEPLTRSASESTRVADRCRGSRRLNQWTAHRIQWS